MSDKIEIPHRGHQVELAADRYRTELIATLQELDRRRSDVMDVKGQIDRHKTALYVVAGGVVLLASAAIAASIIRARNEKALMRRERVRGFIRAWENPQRVASRAKDRPLPSELFRKFAITFGTAIAANYAKKSAAAIFTAKHPAEV